MDEPCEGASFTQTALVTAIPTLCMIAGSAAISLKEPNEQVQACFQNLSAGLLIGAVVTDIFPMLREQLLAATDDPQLQYGAATLGFFGALLLMYGLEQMNEEEEDDKSQRPLARTRSGSLDSLLPPDSDGSLAQPFIAFDEKTMVNSAVGQLADAVQSISKLVSEERVDRDELDKQVHGVEALLHSTRRMCRGAEPIDKTNALRLRHHASELIVNVTDLREVDPLEVHKFDKQLTVVAGTLRHIHKHAERATFRRWGPAVRIRKESSRPKDAHLQAAASEVTLNALPTSFLLAVAVDSGVDGMLIGLASSVCVRSGMLMAVATAVEMGFLGYSAAITLVNAVDYSPKLALLIVPPLIMFWTSLLASSAADAVKGQPAFVGLAAFAMVAVLFLVVQELLREAHEKEGPDGWRVSVWLYAGLFLSIAMDSLL